VPYTKYLVANIVVDLGAALILCSIDAARRHGIAESRWVYRHACTDAFETTPIGVRATLHDQAAVRTARRRALELAGAHAEQIAHVDLYSCFPSAVQIAAAEVGFSTERDLAVTGGLTFAGGPFDSYVMHSLAALVEKLRGDPGSFGVASGIGGYMAKHAWGVYSSAPPAAGYRYEAVTARARSATVIGTRTTPATSPSRRSRTCPRATAARRARTIICSRLAGSTARAAPGPPPMTPISCARYITRRS